MYRPPRIRRPAIIAMKGIALTFGLLSLLLAGCSGDDSPLPNYLARLSRSLDVDIAPPAREAATLPRARELHIDLLPGSIDLLDLLALRNCRLNITIGKSNSSLGKLAGDSQRLLLELEFLALAPPCIDQLKSAGDEELVALLQQAVSDKREQLPARIWNATLAGPEFRDFWKWPTTISGYPRQTGTAVPVALQELNSLVVRWMAGEYGAGWDRLEPLLDRIRRGDGGSLLAALDVQRRYLGSAGPALRLRLTDPPLCYGGQASPESRIVDNVVRKYFVGEVQPWSVDLVQRQQQLIEPVTRLEESLAAVTPPSYQAWMQRRDELLSSSARIPREHAVAIGSLLEQCGLAPGQSGQAGY